MSSRSRIEEGGGTREKEISPGDLVRIVKDEFLSRGLWRTAWLSEDFAPGDADEPLYEVDRSIACLVISVVEFDRAGDKGETALVIESESGLVGWIDNVKHLEKI